MGQKLQNHPKTVLLKGRVKVDLEGQLLHSQGALLGILNVHGVDFLGQFSHI